MKLVIDSANNRLIQENENLSNELPLYSKEGFQIISDLWLKIGWNEKYSYTFTWMGRPIIQLPQDIIRVQEIIYKIKPDVIIETGVAHGGSLIFYASLCKAMGKGRIIGVDIEIRKENRQSIEKHELASFITLVEGNSIDTQVIHKVKSLISNDESVIVILDSLHTKNHVLAELEAYHHLVTRNSYIVATDGIMKDLNDVPRGKSEWKEDNPISAVNEFLQSHPNFSLDTPLWPFNESTLSKDVSYWPRGWLLKKY
jgi:cephalosporin hydroxylase